jgi:hypothetical protein
MESLVSSERRTNSSKGTAIFCNGAYARLFPSGQQRENWLRGRHAIGAGEPEHSASPNVIFFEYQAR